MTDDFPAKAAAIKATLEGQGFTQLVGAEAQAPSPPQQRAVRHGGLASLSPPCKHQARSAARMAIG
jgi:hypothetical protein